MYVYGRCQRESECEAVGGSKIRNLYDTGHGPVSRVRLVCAGPDTAGS